MSTSLTIDLQTVAFSRKEGNLVISQWDREPCEPGLWLRDIYGGNINHLYRLQLVRDGAQVDFTAHCQPHVLELRADCGYVEFVYSKPNCLRIRGAGADLELVRSHNTVGGVVNAPDGCLRSILGAVKLFFRPLHGKISWEAPWMPRPMFGSLHHRSDWVSIKLGPSAEAASGDSYEYLVERYVSEIEQSTVSTSFEEDLAAVKADFEAWRSRAPAAPPEWTEARDLALYINWSSVVPRAGNFHKPAMLMSKIGMCRCWNWDNYFNAWAMSYIDPEFAWDQYLLHFSHQHSTGALADGISETDVQFQYTKPPVHGWILKRMLESQPAYGLGHLRQVYDGLAAWTDWWFTYRDDDGDGVCQYNHGNDSGWDNASIFDMEMPVESPDLSALLVRQMDYLAEMADQLQRPEEASKWRKRSQETLSVMVQHFCKNGEFMACQNGTHLRPPEGDCLLPYLSIVAGSLLPEEYAKQGVAALSEPGRFFTKYGLATEALNSPLFMLKGYWRGAIWAPAMLFAIDGLYDIGERDLARKLARQFCLLCVNAGFSENFCPKTGEGLFDPAYTWTSSAFLLCLARFCPPEGETAKPNSHSLEIISNRKQ